MAAHDATYAIGVDWDNDLFICMEAARTDALNLVPTPVTVGYAIGVVNDATQSAPTLGAERTAYGIKTVTCETGTTTTAGVYFGADPDIQVGNTVDDIAVSESTEYTMAVWVKGVSSYAGVNFHLRAYDQSNNIIASSGNFTLTSAWVQQTLTFTTGAGDTYVALKVGKVSSATDVTFQAAGLMLVAGDTAPSGFNAGLTCNLYDNITTDVMTATWFTGARDERARAGDEATCDLALDNSSKTYSPEYSSSPIYGYIKPNRRIKIKLTQNGTEYEMWNGYIESIDVDTGVYRSLTAAIRGRGTKLQADEAKVLAPILDTNQTADEILTTLFVRSDIIPASDLSGIWRLGVVGYSEVGVSTLLVDKTELFSFETGNTTFAYVGDTWDTEKNIFDAAQETVDAERGWLFQDRTGKLNFYNRHHYQQGSIIAGTINNTWTEMEYRYGDSIINSVSVTFTPRTVGGTGQVLWTSPGTITVPHKETVTQQITFTDDSGQKFSALEIIDPNEATGTYVVTGATAPIVSYEETGTGLILNLISTSQKKDAVITTLTFLGTPLTTFDIEDAVATDGTSIVTFGKHHDNLQLTLLNDTNTAAAIANARVQRYKDPIARVPSVMLASKSQTEFDLMLGLTIGDSVVINDTQTSHSGTHIIIGEEHSVTDAGKLHTTRFFCIPAEQETAWLLGITGRSELGETTILGY